MAAEQKKERIVILGAGPCGLGAAWRLEELARMGHRSADWTIVDMAPYAGGLAQTVVDPQGFSWDMGGHVIFSHYEYFSKTLDFCMNDEWNTLEREAWVWMRQRFIPYPFQNNIRLLPKDDLVKCLDGLLECERNKGTVKKPKNFHEWLENGFGPGLMDVFMTPYNKKVWAYPPEQMNVEWMGERVATVDTGKVLRNIVEEKDELGWGPNATFRFPKSGGTGEIYKRMASHLPQEKFKLSTKVVAVDAAKKVITYADGSTQEYDHIISTLPLDEMCKMTTGLEIPDDELKAAAPKFKYSSSHVVGFGMEGQPPEHLKTKCWLYFPEDDSPFYRATVFSNYSENHVAKPGQQWSLMCEVSESSYKPVDQDGLIALAEQGLRNSKLLADDDVIVSRFHCRLEHGYPTPFYGRDELCKPLFEAFYKANILSRGRFGAWKYEISNQDHSLMQGVEAADNIVIGSEETTFNFPSIVNKYKDRIGRKMCLPPAKPSPEGTPK